MPANTLQYIERKITLVSEIVYFPNGGDYLGMFRRK